MNKLIAIIFLGFLLQGCATILKLDPMALDGQQVVYQEGLEAV
jgi:uncharacterized protein YceK